MFAQERHGLIGKLVREKRRMSFTELQELVKVSPATLRRDLAELERSGNLIRVHGGVLDPAYARAEISFDDRLERNRRAKEAIAAKAVSLIKPGSTVYVDAGSTCLEAGKALLGRKDVRILTNSVSLLSISMHGEAELICLGGELRRVSGALVGATALSELKGLHADVALMGASGLDSVGGCSTTELSEAAVKKLALSRSTRKILLADGSKWESPSTVNFAAWSDLTDWIIERATPGAERLKTKSFQVHLV